MKIEIIIVFLMLSLIVKGQTFTGTYTGQNDGDEIEFISDNEVKFKIYQPDCLGGQFFCGNGTYKLVNNKLKIVVKEHDKSLESNCIIINKSMIKAGFEMKGQVVSKSGDIVSYVYFTFKIGKDIIGFQSDTNGNFSYRFEKKPDSKIQIALVGYTNTYFNYIDNTVVDCKVILNDSKNRFIDGEQIIMKVSFDNEKRTFVNKGLKIK